MGGKFRIAIDEKPGEDNKTIGQKRPSISLWRGMPLGIRSPPVTVERAAEKEEGALRKKTVARAAGAVSLILTALSTAPAQAQESVYTDLDLDACVSISPSPEEEPGGFASLRCKGYQSAPVYFKEFDLRQSVYYGPVSKKIIDEAGETFSAFNHVGKKIEWRLDADGRPTATILRWFIENTNPDTGAVDKALNGQVLVISKVASEDDPMGCVAGYVDVLANPEPNLLARKVADEIAPGFACGVDRPVYYGQRGEKAGEPSYSFPEP
jgi:hypothetical protein